MSIRQFFVLLSVCLFSSVTNSLFAENTIKPINYTRNENFVYDHKTAIIHNGQPGFKLDDRVEQVAKIMNRDLDQSMCFNTEFVKDVYKVRKYHVSTKKSRKENIATLHWVTTADKVKLGCTYFNRNSSTLLVVAGGFTNEREMMTPFVDMFPDYDVVLMDWRGHGFNPEEFVVNPVKRCFSIDPSDVAFGEKEHLDAFAVVEGFRRLKKANNGGTGYSHVYGLGICYGAFVFAKTAALAERLRFGFSTAALSHQYTDEHPGSNRPLAGIINTIGDIAALHKCIRPTLVERELAQLKFNLNLIDDKRIRKNRSQKHPSYTEIMEHGLFDKLILDGCWLSLPLFVEKIKNDFATLANPQTGGLSKHWLLSTGCAKKTINFIASSIVGLKHESSITLLDYTSSLTKTPLLFFFGKDDYMIRRHEFETLYNAIPSPEKTVVLTSNYHVRNHFKQKELYKLTSDLFLRFSQDEFIDYLKSPTKIVTYNAQHFLQACNNVLEQKQALTKPDHLMWPLALPESN